MPHFCAAEQYCHEQRDNCGVVCWPGKLFFGCCAAATLPQRVTLLAPRLPHFLNNHSLGSSVGNGEEGAVFVPCVWRHHATSTAVSHSPCVVIPASLRTRSMPFFSWSSFTTVAFNYMSVLIIVLVIKRQSFSE